MKDKRGQGLSLNVIIVAALALIVLVVLIVVFTRQVGIIDPTISKNANAELIKMKIQYGQCHPSDSFENTFMKEFESAEFPEDQDTVKQDFKDEIDRCKDFSEGKDVCESESGCTWS